MASIAWPPSLPNRLHLNFNYGLRDNAVKIEADPRAVSRPRTTGAVEDVAGTMLLTDAQLETLRLFWRDTAKMGSLFFDFPHPFGGATVDARFTAPPTLVAIRATKSAVAIRLELKF